MNDKIILQLEFKDTFFHLSATKPDDMEYIEFSGSYIVIRKSFKEFIETLKSEFIFSVWTIYPKEVLDIIVTYLSSLGINTLYQRYDAAEFYRDNKPVRREKRLKRLSNLGYSIDRIICIENKIPEFENYNNHFVVEPFYGQKDNDNLLTDYALELLELSKVSDTRFIN